MARLVDEVTGKAGAVRRIYLMPHVYRRSKDRNATLRVIIDRVSELERRGA